MKDILLTIDVKLYTRRKHQPSPAPEERLQAVSKETWTVHVIAATRPVKDGEEFGQKRADVPCANKLAR